MLVSERPQGSFTRQLFLGEGLDAEHIEAAATAEVVSLADVRSSRERPAPRRLAA